MKAELGVKGVALAFSSVHGAAARLAYLPHRILHGNTPWCGSCVLLGEWGEKDRKIKHTQDGSHGLFVS